MKTSTKKIEEEKMPRLAAVSLKYGRQAWKWTAAVTKGAANPRGYRFYKMNQSPTMR